MLLVVGILLWLSVIAAALSEKNETGSAGPFFALINITLGSALMAAGGVLICLGK